MVKRLKPVEVLKLSEGYEKLLQWFFAYPRSEMGLNEAVEKLGVAKTTAKHVVELLEREDFLKIKIYGRSWAITCNPQHPYHYSRKIPNNLRMIYESGILERINQEIPNSRAVILFGSYRKGDDDEKSDIDIAVEVLDNQEPRLHKLGVISQLGYRKDVAVNVTLFSRNKVDLNLFANIANGIVLQGFFEVRP